MLEKIPKSISPDLIKLMMEMGHGDELVLADANFPSSTLANRLVRADGIEISVLLRDILELFPLDSYSEHQVMLMEVVPGDDYKPVIQDEYKKILDASGRDYNIDYLERFAFYDRAEKAFAIVATGEEALYANIIIKKGVVK